MKVQETPGTKEISDLKNKLASCGPKRSCCKDPFSVILLRVFPLLTITAGLIVLVLGFGNGDLKSEILRMVGVVLISFSVFWFVLGNFVNLCMNGYGQDARDIEEEDEENTTSAIQTEVTIEDFLVRGSWI